MDGERRGRHAAGGIVVHGGDDDVSRLAQQAMRAGMEINGWTIETLKGAIGTGKECEGLREELDAFSLPEQIYVSNTLRIGHGGLGVTLEFCAKEALRAWKENGLEPLKLKISDAWKEARKDEMERQGAEDLAYDWTYTTPYSGSACVRDGEGRLVGGRWSPTSKQMDWNLLMARDEILFFDDVLLYASELDDNGVSEVSVKVRVMQKCWYVLMRFFLRVDGQIVRLRETRIFCKLLQNTGEHIVSVLREVKQQEGTHETLLKAGAPGLDGSAYRDADAASSVFQAVAPIALVGYNMEELYLEGAQPLSI